MTFSTLADKEQGAAKWPACIWSLHPEQTYLARLGMDLGGGLPSHDAAKGGQHQRAGWRAGLLAIEGRTGSPSDMEEGMHWCPAAGSSTGQFVQGRQILPRRIGGSKVKSSTAINSQAIGSGKRHTAFITRSAQPAALRQVARRFAALAVESQPTRA
ncbi:hypothetical protein CCMA1212_008869 [Trichoderma ghanense]|uniref:Uncharacterized protein n=1 Tax=Trichoderma ghanense TaxID=65468 RepID=A0ABY2GVB2_9HYPO